MSHRITHVLRIALLTALALSGAGAAESHPEVLVVVNGGSDSSVAIGEAYRRARGIPARNVVVLDAPLPDSSVVTHKYEDTGRERYERLVRDPLLAFLAENDPEGRIQIIVTTKGVPLRVKETVANAPLPTRSYASVDAELAVMGTSMEGSRGLAGSANPFYRSELSFAAWRAQNPDGPLRYLVARLTGYEDERDPGTGVPRDVAALIDRATRRGSGGRWVVDEDPNQREARHAGNALLLRQTASALKASGARLLHDREPGFVSGVDPIAGYASWGSNDHRNPGAPFYGEIGGRVYPGRFGPRAIAVPLVSTNGRTFTHEVEYGQSLAADLVRAGAAGVAAHVYEPTLTGVARPLLLADYARGMPAGEAYYRNLPYLSWTNVYVGDPLMQVEKPLPVSTDADGDGVENARDNCREVANPRQRDTDGDGFGNFCDADFDGNGWVDARDVALQNRTIRQGKKRPRFDLDGDGRVDARDQAFVSLNLYLPPGPGVAGRVFFPVGSGASRGGVEGQGQP